MGELLQGSHTPALQTSRVVFTRGPSSLSSKGMMQLCRSVFLHLSAGPTAAVGSCRGARMGDMEHVYSRIITTTCFTSSASCQTIKSVYNFIILP